MSSASENPSRSAFALISEEESLQDEMLGTGLAFQIEDQEDDEDGTGCGVPMNGMQYLKQVVKEARALDAVAKGTFIGILGTHLIRTY